MALQKSRALITQPFFKTLTFKEEIKTVLGEFSVKTTITYRTPSKVKLYQKVREI